MTDALALFALGFFLGVRHATDADHVVAVAAIVSRERSARSAMAVGALWGLGHSATVFVVGGAIVLFGLVVPPRLGLSMEMSVAVMLVLLGAMNVTGAVRTIREKASALEGGSHAHERDEARGVNSGSGVSLRPLVVGVVHGLAGSAAIALLVLATIRSALSALVYLAVFGAGTVIGMTMLTAAVAAPVARFAGQSPRFERTLMHVTGFASIAFGLFLAYRIGVVNGLFVRSAPLFTPD